MTKNREIVQNDLLSEEREFVKAFQDAMDEMTRAVIDGHVWLEPGSVLMRPDSEDR